MVAGFRASKKTGGGNSSVVEVSNQPASDAVCQVVDLVEEPPRFTFAMLKTILVSGVGFMTDAYDLFIM